MQTRSLLFAATVVVLAGCQEDLTAEKATWDTTTKDWAARLEKIKKGHADLATKVKAFTLPEGDALTAEKAAIDQSVVTGTASIAAVEKDITTAKATIDGLIAKGKKVPLEVALSGTKPTVDGALAKAESLVNASNEALDLLAQKATAAKAQGDAAKSRTEAWLAEAKKKAGMLDIDDLDFKGEAIDLEGSKVALMSLLATLKSCAELKADVTVVSMGEADLATKRAEALKGYLTTNGVNAGVLTKVVGSAIKEGDEKVTVAFTTPCK